MHKIDAQKIIAQQLQIPEEEAEIIIKKAETGQEFTDESDLETWLNNRFFPNIVLIDETGYAKMCIDALKILKSTAATDYGSSRQRDLGQLWGDMTRGYLAEYAFILFLQKNWGIKAELGHEKGVELGAINQQEADLLFDNLPLFQPIPAYIAGFAVKNKGYKNLAYTGKKGRMHFNIEAWNGEIKSGDLQRIKEQEQLPTNGKVKFEGIGDFSHENGYLFNVGNLLWEKEDWENFVIKPL